MSIKTVLAAAAALALLAAPAWAGGATVGTTAGGSIVIAAKATSPYRSVVIKNQSATATISVTDDGTAPVKGAAGSYDVGPGLTIKWGTANTTFTGPFTVISDTASTPVTFTAE